MSEPDSSVPRKNPRPEDGWLAEAEFCGESDRVKKQYFPGMVAGGFILVPKFIIDDPVLKDGDHTAIWIYIIRNAIFSTGGERTVIHGRKGDRKPIKLLCGMLKLTQKEVQEKTKIKPSKINRVLDFFESEKWIGKRTDNESSIITVLNWTIYRKYGKPSGKPLENE